MNKKSLITLIVSLNLCYVPLSMADVGITEGCQDDVQELQDKMRDNKEDYTAESRRKANTQLMAAKIFVMLAGSLIKESGTRNVETRPANAANAKI